MIPRHAAEIGLTATFWGNGFYHDNGDRVVCHERQWQPVRLSQKGGTHGREGRAQGGHPRGLLPLADRGDGPRGRHVLRALGADRHRGVDHRRGHRRRGVERGDAGLPQPAQRLRGEAPLARPRLDGRGRDPGRRRSPRRRRDPRHARPRARRGRARRRLRDAHRAARGHRRRPRAPARACAAASPSSPRSRPSPSCWRTPSW